MAVAATLGQASAVKNVANAIKEVMMGCAKFEFSSSGLSMKKMERSHNVMIEIFVPADAFAHYECYYGTFSVCLFLSRMLDCLDEADNDDIISLTAMEDRNSVTLSFQKSCIPPHMYTVSHFPGMYYDNVSCRLLNTPEEVEYDAIVDLSSACFRTICNHNRSDTINICVTGTDRPTFTSVVDFGTSTAFCTYVPHEGTVIRMTETETVTMKVEMTYVNMVIKAMSLSDTLTIYMSTEKGMVAFEYKIAAERGYVRFTMPIVLNFV